MHSSRKFKNVRFTVIKISEACSRVEQMVSWNDVFDLRIHLYFMRSCRKMCDSWPLDYFETGLRAKLIISWNDVFDLRKVATYLVSTSGLFYTPRIILSKCTNRDFEKSETGPRVEHGPMAHLAPWNFFKFAKFS